MRVYMEHKDMTDEECLRQLKKMRKNKELRKITMTPSEWKRRHSKKS